MTRTHFQAALHRWYRANRRRLPWREKPSLYGTVVSEFMLQQTQVATVLPYFERWIRELPDFGSLAAAPAEGILKRWEGLGYYSRARNLHRLAQEVVARAKPPESYAGWIELPGVGPYTAAAIASIAFGEERACVDGNVVRILARIRGEERLFRGGSEAVRWFSPAADDLVRGTDPGLHNQAMMELGATVCVRQAPRCLVCPVAAFCAARAWGNAAELPRFRPRETERRSVQRAWCLDRGRLLFRAAGEGRRLAGLHELPDLKSLGIALGRDSLIATHRRAITRFQIDETIHTLKPTASLHRRIAEDSAFRWVPIDRLDEVALSGPHRRWIAPLLAARRD